MQRHTGGQLRAVLVPRQVFGHQCDTQHTFRRHLLRDQRYAHGTIHRLPTGHRHGIVVQNLVGDVDVGGKRGANGQITRVKVSPVTEISKHVRALGEGGLTDPRRALATHLRGGLIVFGVDGCSHNVAADPGQRQAAVRHFSRAIVRAAGTIIGGTNRCIHRLL